MPRGFVRRRKKKEKPLLVGDDGVWTNIIQEKINKKKTLWKIWQHWLKGSRLRSKWHPVLPLSHIPSVSWLAHIYTQTEGRQSDFSSSRRRVSWKQKHLRDADKRWLFPKKDLSESTNNLRLKWDPWQVRCVIACFRRWKKKVRHTLVFNGCTSGNCADSHERIQKLPCCSTEARVFNTNERPTSLTS